MTATNLWRRLQQLVIHRILHLDDTPHRIASGVFLGSVVAFTPTPGFQIVIYLLLATALRANKVAGIPILFVSNPFTAVPVTYITWWVGAALLNPKTVVTSATIRAWLGDTSQTLRDEGLSQLLDQGFWTQMLALLGTAAGELWLGGILCGLIVGLPAYFSTRWAINAVRHLREARGLPHGPMDP